MTRKDIRNILLLSLIGYWAVLGFKPAYADSTLTLNGNQTEDGLQIGGESTYSELIVNDSASTTDAVIQTGGVANYDDSSSGGGTIINGGNVYANQSSTLTNTTITSGLLHTKDSSSINIVNMTNGEILIDENSTANDITMSGGTLKIQSTQTAENITVSGGDLSVGGDVQYASVSSVTFNNGTAVVSNWSSADDVTINDGDFTVVENSDITNSTIVNGSLTIEEGSYAGGLNVNGGQVTVTNGSSSEFLTITGGDVSVEDGSSIDSSTVSNGGYLYIDNNGGDAVQAFNITVNYGGNMTTGGSDTTISDTIVNAGGTAEFTENSNVFNTTINGGTVNAKDSVLLLTSGSGQNILKNNGELTLEQNVKAENFTLEQGSVVLSDNAELSNATITGNVSVELGKHLDPSASGGVLSDITVENGGNLWAYNTKGSTGGKVEDITVKDGGMLTSNVKDTNDGTYSNILNGENITIEQGGKFNLSTDDEIDGLKTYDKNGNLKEGSISLGVADSFVVGNGSTFTIKKNDGAAMISVEEGTVNIENNGSFIYSSVTDGTVNVETGGVVESVSFDGNSVLNAETGSTLSSISLLGNTEVNIEDYSSFADNLTVGKNVVGLDASQLFVSGTNLTGLTLVGGLNSTFVNGIINQDTITDHVLTLNDGNYDPAEINGWKDVKLINAVLDLKNDLGLVNGGLNIDSNSTLTSSGSFSIKQGSVYNYGTIDLVTKSGSATDTLAIEGDYVGVAGSKLNLNVDIASAEADKIIIYGSASGSTKVYLTSLNDGAALRDDILFAQAGGASGENAFVVNRVAGSYYHWDTVFDNNKWYASLKNAIKDDKYVLVPEAVAYYGLIDNTFMQTSSLGESLRNNIAISEYQKTPCKNAKRGANDICRSNRPVFSGWLAPATTSITVDSPYIYDADIGGFDGGLDLLSNGSTKLGLLASYRKGSYNYEENGEKYEIIGQAETTINTYLAGAYLRHDGQNWSTILAGYAGIIDADISTSDDINTSTSGTTYGATLDVSYIYKNISGLRIEPGVRISYTTVELDPVKDNAGKTQEFDNASRTEIEAGIKFAKRWEFPDSRAEIFIKPSIVHIMDDTSEFVIDEENSLAQADDRTVAKVSAGISFDMTSSLSASLAGSYSVGDDYTNSSGNLSVMYRF